MGISSSREVSGNNPISNVQWKCFHEEKVGFQVIAGTKVYRRYVHHKINVHKSFFFTPGTTAIALACPLNGLSKSIHSRIHRWHWMTMILLLHVYQMWAILSYHQRSVAGPALISWKYSLVAYWNSDVAIFIFFVVVLLEARLYKPSVSFEIPLRFAGEQFISKPITKYALIASILQYFPQKCRTERTSISQFLAIINHYFHEWAL